MRRENNMAGVLHSTALATIMLLAGGFPCVVSAQGYNADGVAASDGLIAQVRAGRSQRYMDYRNGRASGQSAHVVRSPSMLSPSVNPTGVLGTLAPAAGVPTSDPKVVLVEKSSQESIVDENAKAPEEAKKSDAKSGAVAETPASDVAVEGQVLFDNNKIAPQYAAGIVDKMPEPVSGDGAVQRIEFIDAQEAEAQGLLPVVKQEKVVAEVEKKVVVEETALQNDVEVSPKPLMAESQENVEESAEKKSFWSSLFGGGSAAGETVAASVVEKPEAVEVVDVQPKMAVRAQINTSSGDVSDVQGGGASEQYVQRRPVNVAEQQSGVVQSSAGVTSVPAPVKNVAPTPFEMSENELNSLPAASVPQIVETVTVNEDGTEEVTQEVVGDVAMPSFAPPPPPPSAVSSPQSGQQGIFGGLSESSIYNAGSNEADSGTANASIYTEEPAARRNYLKGLDGYIVGGYRNDRFDWNIASELNSPIPENILSELKWKIQSTQLETGVSYTVPSGFLKNLYLEGAYDTSTAFSGDNQDSDYAYSGRNAEFSRSNNDSSDSSADSTRFALGYSMNMMPGNDGRDFTTTFTPVIGLSMDDQHYVMTDGFQTIPAYGAFDGLNSTYDATWDTQFIGFRMQYANHVNSLKISGDYFMGDYEAEANWNLREEFMHPRSYTHTSDANGYKIGVSYSRKVLDGFGIFVAASYMVMRGDDGLDTVYFTDGTTAMTALNEVNLASQFYSIGMNYRW